MRTSEGSAETGASGVEYAALLAAIALAIYVAVSLMGSNVSQSYDDFGTKAGAPNTTALQRKLQGALGIPSGLSPQGQINACNNAASRAGSASGPSPSGFNESCAAAMAQSLYPTAADFMSGMNIPIGASATQRQAACGAGGLTGAALSSCVGTSGTAFGIMNGTIPAASWSSSALPTPRSASDVAFNNWISSQP